MIYRHLKTYFEELKSYQISPLYFLGTLLFQIMILFLIARVLALELGYCILISLVCSLFFPYILLSYYRHRRDIQTFQQLHTYMEYMMLHFLQSPNIYYALKETLPYLEGKMTYYVQQAIQELEMNEDEKTAFAVIETAFSNKRLVMMHQFMRSVEAKSSAHYKDTLLLMKTDTKQWFDRCLMYLSELKVIKRNYKLAVLICLIISAILCLFYQSQPLLLSFTHSLIYQSVTTVYVFGLYGIWVMSDLKLHGKWVYQENQPSHCYEKYVDYLRSGHHALSKKQRRLAYGCLFLSLGFVFYHRYFLSALSIGLSLLIVFNDTFLFQLRKKTIHRAIEKEFPYWLSFMTLLLYDRSILNAIQETLDYSFVLKPYLLDLVDAIYRDPVTLEPYRHFLKEFNQPMILEASKALYSITNGHDVMSIQEFVKQNLNRLEHAEKLRNEDSIASIGFSIHTTTVLFMIKTICDLFLLIITAIGAMKGLI